MTAWSEAEFAALSTDEELTIVVSREGHETKRLPIWMVTVGDDVYVRSYKGVTSMWFRRVEAEHSQAIETAAGDIPVLFEDVDRTDHVNAAIDRAYRAKYAKYDYVEAMDAPAAVEATLRIHRS